MTQATRGATRQAGRADQAAQSVSPQELLQASLQQLAGTLTERAVSNLSGHLTGATDRLTNYAQGGGGGPGLLAAVTGIDKLASGASPMKAALAGGIAGAKGKVKESLQNIKDSVLGRKGKAGKNKSKITNIVEHIDVGVPVELAYKQWTQFGDFPKFMKKLESVDQVSDEKLQWKAQVFLSHRTWESTIIDQVPNDHIVWRSKGQKGYIDGAITFHELAPNLTRIIAVLEYHPQGLFEKTGNIWRAQGRRMRLELKHFQREVMTKTLLHPDDVEGWQGEIHDSKVVSNGQQENGQQKQKKTTGPKATASPKRRAAPRSRTGNGSSETRRRATTQQGSQS